MNAPKTPYKYVANLVTREIPPSYVPKATLEKDIIDNPLRGGTRIRAVLGETVIVGQVERRYAPEHGDRRILVNLDQPKNVEWANELYRQIDLYPAQGWEITVLQDGRGEF